MAQVQKYKQTGYSCNGKKDKIKMIGLLCNLKLKKIKSEIGTKFKGLKPKFDQNNFLVIRRTLLPRFKDIYFKFYPFLAIKL